jgi:hypothetical protein
LTKSCRYLVSVFQSAASACFYQNHTDNGDSYYYNIAPFKGIFFGKTVVAKQEYGNNLIPLLIVICF